MTQPVQEPSQGRTDQAQAFAGRQLFRRPASGLQRFGYATRYEAGGVTQEGYVTHSGGQIQVDAAAPGGVVYRTSGANGNFVTYDLMLGPYYSVWDFDLWYKIGPSFGILLVQLSSFSTGPGGPPTLGGGPDGFVTIKTIDMYNAAPSYVLPLSAANSQSIRITGDDYAAFTTVDTGPAIDEIDGGSGPYRMRLIVNGQNGSSSGFDCDLLGWVVQRDIEDGGVWPP